MGKRLGGVWRLERAGPWFAYGVCRSCQTPDKGAAPQWHSRPPSLDCPGVPNAANRLQPSDAVYTLTTAPYLLPTTYFPQSDGPFFGVKSQNAEVPRRASHPQRMQACEQLLVLVAPQYVTWPAHVKASSARIGINICSCTESNLCPPETRYAIHIVAALTRQSPPQTCPSSAGGAPRTRHSR